MRRNIALALSLLLLFGAVGCAETPAQDTLPPETTQAPTVETTLPETKPALEGELLLSVAQINFSLVGESEDICVGTADRSLIRWQSDDESVIKVEDGVLTAVGVGSTTVTAYYGDQMQQCIAGCLANTEEELYQLSDDIIRSPKRIPPVYENPPLEFFDDAALMGDSITYIMFKYELASGIMGNPLYLTRSGTGICGLLYRYSNIVHQGKEWYVEDVVAETGARKLFIMLGQNDLGWRSVEATLADLDPFIERIRQKQPDAEFYFQSVIYEWHLTGSGNFRNEKIAIYNERLRRYCEENGHHYVDIQKYVEDHTKRMPHQFNLDNQCHMNEEGCTTWMHVLNNYAYLVTIGAEP